MSYDPDKNYARKVIKGNNYKVMKKFIITKQCMRPHEIYPYMKCNISNNAYVYVHDKNHTRKISV